MDNFDMLELELPSAEGIAELDDPVGEAAAADNTAGAGADETGGEDYSYDYDGGELENMAAPMLSEMDGSELGSFQTPKAAGASSERSSSGADIPVISEMSAAPMGQQRQQGQQMQSGQYGQRGQSGQQVQSGFNASGNGYGNSSPNNFPNNSGNNMPMNNVQGQSGGYGGAGQSTYAPVNNSGTGSVQGRTDYYDYLDADSELVAKGIKVAKTVGTITIIVSVLSGLTGLLSLSSRTVVSAAYCVYFSIKFMKGSQNSQYWLGAGCVLRMLLYIISLIDGAVNSAEYTAEYGSVVLSIAQFMCLTSAAVYGVLAYFYLLNKSVAAFCKRSGSRGEL